MLLKKYVKVFGRRYKLSEQEYADALAFANKHDIMHKQSKDIKYEYETDTSSGIGIGISIVCPVCGEKLNITDYSTW